MAATTIPIKDAIQDLVKNVVGPGFFDKIKIASDSKGTVVESLEKDKQVILKGRMTNPVQGWDGEFGLSNLSLLSSIVNDPEFTHKDSTLELVTQQRGGADVPTELHYTNRSESFIAYRFVSKELVPNQPTYKEPTWDVSVRPTKASIQQFNWMASSLGSYESYFIPKTVDGNLRFFIGEEDAATQRGGVMFAQDVKGSFSSQHKWPVNLISPVFKLVSDADAMVHFSVKGAIQIDLMTGLGEYKFIFPGKIR